MLAVIFKPPDWYPLLVTPLPFRGDDCINFPALQFLIIPCMGITGICGDVLQILARYFLYAIDGINKPLAFIFFTRCYLNINNYPFFVIYCRVLLL